VKIEVGDKKPFPFHWGRRARDDDRGSDTVGKTLSTEQGCWEQNEMVRNLQLILSTAKHQEMPSSTSAKKS